MKRYTSLKDMLPIEPRFMKVYCKRGQFKHSENPKTLCYVGMSDEIVKWLEAYKDTNMSGFSGALDWVVLSVGSERRHGVNDRGEPFSWIDLVITVTPPEEWYE